jgi:hypothetical protein
VQQLMKRIGGACHVLENPKELYLWVYNDSEIRKVYMI